MKLPVHMPARATGSEPRAPRLVGGSGLSPQGCSVIKKIGCAAAIAGCVASGVGVVACLAGVAPGCIDCV